MKLKSELNKSVFLILPLKKYSQTFEILVKMSEVDVRNISKYSTTIGYTAAQSKKKGSLDLSHNNIADIPYEFLTKINNLQVFLII